MATRLRCRALRTLRVDHEADDDVAPHERWHVPGKPSAVFWTTEKRALALQENGDVVLLDVGAGDDELPADDEAPDSLPLDFPYRKHLVRAGLDTREAVRTFPDLTEVAGIGESYAEAILDALDELEGEGG